MPQVESAEEVARAKAAERAQARVKELEAVLNSYAPGDHEAEVETLAQEMWLAATRDGQQSNCGWKGLVTDQRDYWKRFARRYLHRVAAASEQSVPGSGEGAKGCEACGGSGEHIIPACPGFLAEFGDGPCPECNGTGKQPNPPGEVLGREGAVSDKEVEAATQAAFTPPVSDDRRSDMRAALEAARRVGEAQ
jgi:hypothetical protein